MPPSRIYKLTSFLFVFGIVIFSGKGQTILNADFEEPCDSFKTTICEWELSWGGKGAVSQGVKGGNKYLRIEGKADNSVGFVEQYLFFPTFENIQLLTVSANIHSENVHGRGAGINIGMYDDSGYLLSTKDMGGFYSRSWISGYSDWERYTLKAVIPIGTVKINIGAILYGSGVAGFDNYEVSFNTLDNRKPNRLSRKYISKAIKIVSANSLVRDSINKKDLKLKSLQIAGKAETFSDCHLAIGYILESLRDYGDLHSYFIDANEVDFWENNTEPEGQIDFPEFNLKDGCGYVLVPAFHGGNVSLMSAYADSLHSGLNILYKKGLKGWIVDLRENTGGNMEPMITGLGPLFDTGMLGSLVDVNGKSESWFYRNGTYYWEKEKGISVSDPVIFTQKLPIAVLTGNRTGSSGEVVVISFKGNSETKFFGQSTWGLTTGNGAFELPDGSRMMLASTVMADRFGNKYEDVISPDVEITAPSEHEDLTLKASIDWILQK